MLQVLDDYEDCSSHDIMKFLLMELCSISSPSNLKAYPSHAFHQQIGSKRKRTCSPEEMEKGVARAHRFLQDFTALPLDQLDEKQVRQCVSKLTSDLEKDAAEFPWLQQFF